MFFRLNFFVKHFEFSQGYGQVSISFTFVFILRDGMSTGLIY